MNIRSEFGGSPHEQAAAEMEEKKRRNLEYIRGIYGEGAALEEEAKDEMPPGETRTVREVRLEHRRLSDQMMEIASREQQPVSEETRASTEEKLAAARRQKEEYVQRQQEAREASPWWRRVAGSVEEDPKVRSYDRWIQNAQEAIDSLERVIGPDPLPVVNPATEAERRIHAELKAKLAAMVEKYPWLKRDTYSID